MRTGELGGCAGPVLLPSMLTAVLTETILEEFTYDDGHMIAFDDFSYDFVFKKVS